MTTEVVEEAALARLATVERSQVGAEAPFAAYDIERPDEVPAFAPVGGEVKVTVTGSAHDRRGRLRKV